VGVTTVINVKDAPEGWMGDPRYCYIDRYRFDLSYDEAERGFDGRYGNPYPLLSERQRGAVLDQYRRYLARMVGTYGWFRRRLEALDGKILVCFCAPLPCHGDVIVEWLEGDRS
jgi:hypothetical protein